MENETLILMAEQQLIGYILASEGGSERELVESMELMLKEWETIKSFGICIPPDLISAIDSILKND